MSAYINFMEFKRSANSFGDSYSFMNSTTPCSGPPRATGLRMLKIYMEYYIGRCVRRIVPAFKGVQSIWVGHKKIDDGYLLFNEKLGERTHVLST